MPFSAHLLSRVHRFAALLALTVALPSLLPAQAVSPTATEETIVLSPFTVQTEAREGYVETQSTTGSLIATPISESPYSINVINRQFIDDLQLDDFEDVGRYSSTNTSNLRSNPNQIAFARGFQMENLRNGYAPGGRVYLTPAYERVEILKGPNSVLYGLANPGGGINFISKRPKFSRETSATVTLGSFDEFQTLIDTTAPLDAFGGKTIAYRLVAATSTTGGDKDFEDSDYFVLAPSLTVRPLPGLELFGEYEYLDYDFTTVAPVPIVNGRYDLTNLGYGRDFNAAGPDAGTENLQRSYNLGATYTFLRNYTLRYQFNRTTRSNVTVLPWNPVAANQRAQLTDGSNNVKGHTVDALAKYEFGNYVKGNLLLGYDYNYNYFATPVYRFRNAAGADPSVPNALLFPNGFGNATREQLRLRNTADPANNFPVATRRDLQVPANLIQINGRILNEFENWRVANTLNVGDRLTLVTAVSRGEVTVTGAPPALLVQKQSETPYQFGFSYRLLANTGGFDYLNLYGQRATSFRNQFGNDAFRRPVPPNNGEVNEVGIKFSLAQGKLSGWIAYFDQVQNNIRRTLPIQPVDDPSTPADETSDVINVASGREGSQGFDFRLDYQPTPQWNFAFEGTVFDGSVESDVQVPERVGLPLQSVPETAFSLIASRRFDSGRLNGLTSGFAISYRDAYLTNNTDFASRNLRTSEIALVDLFFNYRSQLFGRNVSYNVKVNNLLNENPYVVFNGTWGDPLEVKAAMRIEF